MRIFQWRHLIAKLNQLFENKSFNADVKFEAGNANVSLKRTRIINMFWCNKI